MELIDSHAHLDMLDDAATALERARAAGVVQVVSIGIDLATSRAAAELAAQHPNVFATVGLHPHDADQVVPGFWEAMTGLAHSGGAKAIGECGLDFFRDRSPRTLQREAFARQIEMALDLELPLVIHDRDAHDEVAAMLREQDAGRVGGVVHCFSGDLAMARKVLDLGFSLGITGTITYPKNQALRDLVQAVPLERLLVETDCPFLAPQRYRGKPNQPAYVLHCAEGLAQALGRPLEEVAAATTANTRRVFGLPGGES